MSESLIIGPDGKIVKSQRYDVCPNCGKGPEERVPSGGFGRVYLVCKCAYEFKDLEVNTVQS